LSPLLKGTNQPPFSGKSRDRDVSEAVVRFSFGALFFGSGFFFSLGSSLFDAPSLNVAIGMHLVTIFRSIGTSVVASRLSAQNVIRLEVWMGSRQAEPTAWSAHR
jgi:hypothetical protein